MIAFARRRIQCTPVECQKIYRIKISVFVSDLYTLLLEIFLLKCWIHIWMNMKLIWNKLIRLIQKKKINSYGYIKIVEYKNENSVFRRVLHKTTFVFKEIRSRHRIIVEDTIVSQLAEHVRALHWNFPRFFSTFIQLLFKGKHIRFAI